MIKIEEYYRLDINKNKKVLESAIEKGQELVME